VTADDEILFPKQGKSNMIPVSSSPFHVTQHAGRDGKAAENFNMLEITLWCDDTNLSELTKEQRGLPLWPQNCSTKWLASCLHIL